MMVKMLVHITGYRNEVEWPEVGGVIDLPDHEATDLITAGYAKETTDAPTANDDEPAPADPDSDGTSTEDGPEAEGDAEADVVTVDAPAPVKSRARKRT